jgi:hypothetical protein
LAFNNPKPEYYSIRFHDSICLANYFDGQFVSSVMRTRYIAIAVLALSLGGLAAEHRVVRASRFQKYYTALHEEEPELNAFQRVLVSLALTTGN